MCYEYFRKWCNARLEPGSKVSRALHIITLLVLDDRRQEEVKHCLLDTMPETRP